MKLLYLITLLFNYFFAASYDYISLRQYLLRGDYENKLAAVLISSNLPLTDEAINALLAPVGFDNSWEYALSAKAGLLSPDAPIHNIEEYDEYEYERMISFDPFTGESTGADYSADHTLVTYTREPSELFETSYTGQLPDINTDTGGMGDSIPVAASFNSPLNIGDTAQYNYRGKQISVTVTAKYTDDYLSIFAESNGRAGLEPHGSWLLTDREIMYKYGVEPRPEEQEPYTVPEGREDMGEYYNQMIYVTAENMPYVEFADSLSKLKGDEYYTVTEIGGAIPYVGALDNDNTLIINSLPLFVLIFLIGSVGAAANGFLNLDSRKKAMAVFDICGMRTNIAVLLIFGCEAMVTLTATAAAVITAALLQLILPVTLISPLGGIISSGYIVLLSLIMAAVQTISIEHNDSLDVIRSSETL